MCQKNPQLYKTHPSDLTAEQSTLDTGTKLVNPGGPRLMTRVQGERGCTKYIPPLSSYTKPIPPLSSHIKPIPPLPSYTKPIPPLPSYIKPIPPLTSFTKPIPPLPSYTKPIPPLPTELSYFLLSTQKHTFSSFPSVFLLEMKIFELELSLYYSCCLDSCSQNVLKKKN